MTPYEKGFEDCKKQVKAAMVLAIEEAILMEREACAQVCEELSKANWTFCNFAEAIRARWQK
jgi:hypothetical protein